MLRIFIRSSAIEILHAAAVHLWFNVHCPYERIRDREIFFKDIQLFDVRAPFPQSHCLLPPTRSVLSSLPPSLQHHLSSRQPDNNESTYFSPDIAQNARNWNERQNMDSQRTRKNHWYVAFHVILHFVFTLFRFFFCLFLKFDRI